MIVQIPEKNHKGKEEIYRGEMPLKLGLTPHPNPLLVGEGTVKRRKDDIKSGQYIILFLLLANNYKNILKLDSVN